jgi:hypothetical protein
LVFIAITDTIRMGRRKYLVIRSPFFEDKL